MALLWRATSLLNPHLPRPHSTIRLHLSHERNAVADRERHFVLTISDVNEKVRAGIVIEFEEAVASLVLKFHTNAELLFGLFGFQFRHQFGIDNHDAWSQLTAQSASCVRNRSWPETQSPSQSLYFRVTSFAQRHLIASTHSPERCAFSQSSQLYNGSNCIQKSPRCDNSAIGSWMIVGFSLLSKNLERRSAMFWRGIVVRVAGSMPKRDVNNSGLL
jgi:hypothetical protein